MTIILNTFRDKKFGVGVVFDDRGLQKGEFTISQMVNKQLT